MFLPDDPGYDETRQVWNRHYDRKPAIIVQALGTADVVQAVAFAKDSELPVSVRSGGHHVSRLGACDQGMMIDMSRMRSVIVNPNTGTAVVQGGATAADVIRETQLFGLAVPTGNIGRVGVAALALGGGMGYLRRQYGLTCDHLEAADLVLADGSAVHVNRESGCYREDIDDRLPSPFASQPRPQSRRNFMPGRCALPTQNAIALFGEKGSALREFLGKVSMS